MAAQQPLATLRRWFAPVTPHAVNGPLDQCSDEVVSSNAASWVKASAIFDCMRAIPSPISEAMDSLQEEKYPRLLIVLEMIQVAINTSPTTCLIHQIIKRSMNPNEIVFLKIALILATQ